MLYDVFVVGAKDRSPVAQMHLAAKLAEHFHAPAAQIAQAISSRNLRAGQGLDDAQAHILAQQLATFGAETEFRPAVSKKDSARDSKRGAGPTTQVGGGMAPSTRITGVHTAVAGPPSMAGGYPSTGVSGGYPNTGVSSPPVFGNPGTDVVGRDPFAGQNPDTTPLPTLTSLGGHTALSGPPGFGGTSVSSQFTNATRSGGPTALGRDPFGPPSASGDSMPRLELSPQGQRKANESDEAPRQRKGTAPSGVVGTSIGLASDSSDSGVAVVENAKNHMVRCSTHGLYFDKRTSSGCRMCLAPARQRAAAHERNALGFKLRGLRDNPTKHAGIGLALALGLGLIPAGIHAFRFGLPEVMNLRSEQGELSRQVGTEKVVSRYNEIDVLVDEAHGRNMRNTALIWILGGSLALLGWNRIT